LKRPRNIRKALSVASCSLLSSVSQTTNAEEAKSDSEWVVDTAILNYQEEDRVHVFAPVVSAKRFYGEDKTFEFKFVFDSMSGPSPNGATETGEIQTFSGPSGSSDYSTPANETPTHEFSDKRFAFNLVWDSPMDHINRKNFGLNLSIEDDYYSFGGSTAFSWNNANRHTTFTFGASLGLDLIQPNGGTPVPLSDINEPTPEQQFNDFAEDDDDGDDEHEGDEDFESKLNADVLFGITQIINKRTLMQFNYTHAYRNGYLNDPYKIVPVVDSVTGDNIVSDPAVPGKNVYLTEKRPDYRNNNALYWNTIVHLRKDSVRFSYRYFWDNWDVVSHTADIKYRFELGAGFYLQPRYRYYHQSAAYFYRHSITDVERPSIQYVSADYRLGEMVTQTYGLKIGKSLKGGGFISFRVEQMVQTGDSYPDDAIGSQKNYNLFPTVKALIIQLSFAKKF